MTTFLLLWAVLATVAWVYQKFLKDRCHTVLVCPNENFQHAVAAISARHGMPPRFRIDSRIDGKWKILRALTDCIIFNVVLDKSLWERMGRPRASLVCITKTPLASASEDMIHLSRAFKLEAELLQDIDPGVPRDKLVGLKLRGGEDNFCIIYRRNKFRMGEKFLKMPPKWHWHRVAS